MHKNYMLNVKAKISANKNNKVSGWALSHASSFMRVIIISQENINVRGLPKIIITKRFSEEVNYMTDSR